MPIEWSKLSGTEKLLVFLSIIVILSGSITALIGLSGLGLSSATNSSIALGVALAMGGFSIFVICVNSINMKSIRAQLDRIEKQTKTEIEVEGKTDK
jgi:hypothetical protein